MGGFFSKPSPAPVYVAPVAETDPEAEARKQREAAIARNRRGRAGMVATSDRGVLAPVMASGKTLLGE